MQTLRETWLIFRRSLILTLRQPVWLLMGIFQPILYLVLFGPLLEGAVTQAGAGVNAFDWFVPGMLVMVAVFGAAFVGFGLIAELRYGVIERMRVTPMSRTAMLLGRSLRDAVLLLMQAVIMIVIAIPFGITHRPGRPGRDAWRSSASSAWRWRRCRTRPRSCSRARTPSRPLVQFVALPLLLLSGIFLPAPARAGLAPDAVGPQPGDATRSMPCARPSTGCGATRPSSSARRSSIVIAVVAVWTRVAGLQPRDLVAARDLGLASGASRHRCRAVESLHPDGAVDSAGARP